MGKLDGRVAAITSGSTGIGRGIAEGFLAEGAQVVINGRNADKGANALKEMDAGDNGFFVQGDATVREDIDKLIDGAVEHFGRVDILVNNAGGLIKTAPVMDLSDEDWDYAIRWNLYSAFWGTRKALNHMVPQGFGRIINISSVEGKHGKPGIPAYVVSKHAMNGLTKAVAKEVGTTGVTCNAICPGLVHDRDRDDHRSGQREGHGHHLRRDDRHLRAGDRAQADQHHRGDRGHGRAAGLRRRRRHHRRDVQRRRRYGGVLIAPVTRRVPGRR